MAPAPQEAALPAAASTALLERISANLSPRRVGLAWILAPGTGRGTAARTAVYPSYLQCVGAWDPSLRGGGLGVPLRAFQPLPTHV